jgi:hypothetical protein
VEAWDGWPFARLYLLLVALGFTIVGAQVFLFHWRGGFRKWTMYGPVMLAPLIVLAGVVGAIARDGWLGWAALVVFVFGIVDGMVGVFEHFRGIVGRVGGVSLRNLMSGPPPFLPAAFMALALTGALALVWQAL